VQRQIVALACEGSVNGGEHEQIVEEAIEHRGVTGELGVPELGLAGKDFIVDAHISSESLLASGPVLPEIVPLPNGLDTRSSNFAVAGN
jgi:hypothetical protein